jgi:hypothetical protein
MSKIRLYTVYYISVNCSLYMFRVITLAIIRSAHKCKYRVWHSLNRLCCRLLSWRSCKFQFHLLHESRRYHSQFYQCQMLYLHLCVLLIMDGVTTPKHVEHFTEIK